MLIALNLIIVRNDKPLFPLTSSGFLPTFVSEAGVFPVGWICMMIRITRMRMIRMKIVMMHEDTEDKIRGLFPVVWI